MASHSELLAYTLCLILCICSLQTSVTAIEVMEPAAVNLTYYLHEVRGGPGTNGTLWAAAGTGSASNNVSTSGVGWGTFFVFDSPLREGQTENATLLGKSTGTATVTTKGGIPDGGVMIYCQHIFNNATIYNKSSIMVGGQVDFTNVPPWEAIVFGGTGYFRGWRGYGLAELMTSSDAPLIVYKWSIFISK
ncbi:hypothetical protein M758_6G140100 [Ceratodon purpureus]|nr:hypothetical protein M758_6G140100 [Ceratodon purpureus]